MAPSNSHNRRPGLRARSPFPFRSPRPDAPDAPERGPAQLPGSLITWSVAKVNPAAEAARQLGLVFSMAASRKEILR